MTELHAVPDDGNDLAPPDDLGPAGLALWNALTTEYDFEAQDVALVAEAARVKDRLEDLDKVVRRDGVTIDTPQGLRAHPALVEARQQGIVFTRLVASLRLPDDAGMTPQYRGPRGAYRARKAN